MSCPDKQVKMSSVVPTQTLHKVLEKIEEMKLPEGEYLALANLLKTQHKKDDVELRCVDIYNEIKFIGKKTWTIETRKRFVYLDDDREDDIEYTFNGVVKRKRRCQFLRSVYNLYLANLTDKIVMCDGECEITLKEFVAQVRESEEALNVDNEEDGSYTSFFVMSQVFGV